MVPRYVPAPASFLPAAGGDAVSARQRVLTKLGGGVGWEERAYSSLRHGLHAYFTELQGQGPRREVLMSAQVCPVVPLAARAAGLRPRFVDIAADAPTPDCAQFVAALRPETAAMLVAPFYGHLGGDWTLPPREACLVLDLAQGIGLGEGLVPLLERADAVGFSFGLGKGLDTGDALLLTRDAPRAPARRSAPSALPKLKAAALWFLAASGLYALLPRDTIEAGASADAFTPDPASGQAPDYVRWALSLDEFLQAIRLARERARLLADSAFAGRVKCAASCFDPRATHLRQLVRVEGPAARARLLEKLRAAGIDCEPAGERLPHEYLSGAPPGDAFPNAVRFKAEAIRLPFLGRLGEADFAKVHAALERAFG